MISPLDKRSGLGEKEKEKEKELAVEYHKSSTTR
jgi:hypothetical protein